MDVYNREILVWTVDKRMKKELVIKVMERVLLRIPPKKGLVINSALDYKTPIEYMILLHVI